MRIPVKWNKKLGDEVVHEVGDGKYSRKQATLSVIITKSPSWKINNWLNYKLISYITIKKLEFITLH